MDSDQESSDEDNIMKQKVYDSSDEEASDD